MICFIVGADGADNRVQALTKLTGQLGYAAATAPSLDALRVDRRFIEASRPLVLVPDLSAGSGAAAAVAFAESQHGHAFTAYVADTLAPDLYKQLVRTQAGEWIGWTTCVQELRDLAKTLAGAEAAQRAAKIVSFLPSKGGVGNTTLAIETAAHLAARRHRSGGRVAILDLNLRGGTLADALDIEPRFDVGELIERPERLDEQLIDIFTSRCSARLDIFASPPRQIGLEALPPQTIFTFIDSIAKRYEAILIDLPNQWAPWIDNILQGSDAVAAIGAATVPGLKRLAATLSHLDMLEIRQGRLAVAVNQCDADLFGRIPRLRDIERALAGRQIFCVRRDVATACGALDSGRPLLEVSPNARISRDIKRLADWIGAAAEQA